MAWMRVDEGVTEVRTLETTGEGGVGGIPRAALSSADLRTARLMWADAVAGRKFGAGEEDAAGVEGVAGANLLAGVMAAAGALGTASVFLWCVDVDSCLDGDFLVEVAAGLVEEETFLVATAATAALVCVVEDACFVSLTALAAFSVVALVFEDEEGFAVEDEVGLVLELLLTFGFDEDDGTASCFLAEAGVGMLADVLVLFDNILVKMESDYTGNKPKLNVILRRESGIGTCKLGRI